MGNLECGWESSLLLLSICLTRTGDQVTLVEGEILNVGLLVWLLKHDFDNLFCGLWGT